MLYCIKADWFIKTFDRSDAYFFKCQLEGLSRILLLRSIAVIVSFMLTNTSTFYCAAVYDDFM